MCSLTNNVIIPFGAAGYASNQRDTCYGAFLRQLVPNPFARPDSRRILSTATVQRALLLLQFPQYQSANQPGYDGRSRYNALQLRADKRFGAGHRTGDKWHGHVLCYLGLHRFRLVNDTCGHAAGDKLLRQLGTMLQEIMRPGDTLARLGGDEFGLLLGHFEVVLAEPLANEICRAIEGFKFYWKEQRFHIGASIGLVAITPVAGGVTELLAAADTACYVAKEKGRQRVHVYRPDDVELPRRRQEMRWVNRIKRAMADKRLRLYAQPIEPTVNTGEGEWLELLLRLEGEDGTLVSAGVFLPAVERYGLATNLDCWVVTHAFRWLASMSVRQNRFPCAPLTSRAARLAMRCFCRSCSMSSTTRACPPAASPSRSQRRWRSGICPARNASSTPSRRVAAALLSTTLGRGCPFSATSRCFRSTS